MRLQRSDEGTVGPMTGTLCSRVLISPDAVENMSRATISASAVGGRPPGTFERQLITISESRRGTSGRTSIRGRASRVRTAARTPWGEEASNGDLPLSSS